jgi:hypothetical protein
MLRGGGNQSIASTFKVSTMIPVSETKNPKCNIPDIKSMQNINKMIEMVDEQQYNQKNTTIISK